MGGVGREAGGVRTDEQCDVLQWGRARREVVVTHGEEVHSLHRAPVLVVVAECHPVHALSGGEAVHEQGHDSPGQNVPQPVTAAGELGHVACEHELREAQVLGEVGALERPVLERRMRRWLAVCAGHGPVVLVLVGPPLVVYVVVEGVGGVLVDGQLQAGPGLRLQLMSLEGAQAEPLPCLPPLQSLIGVHSQQRSAEEGQAKVQLQQGEEGREVAQQRKREGGEALAAERGVPWRRWATDGGEELPTPTVALHRRRHAGTGEGTP